MEEEIDETFFTDSLEENKADLEVQTTGLEHSFNDRQVGSVALAIEPINGGAGLDVALERFDSQPDLKAIPVEENDRVIGVIERKVVEESTNSALKRFVSKTCIEYVKECSFTVNCNDFLEKISAKANETALGNDIHHFIVQLNNRSFYGIVSIEDINARIEKIRAEDLKKAEAIQKNLINSATNTKGFPFDVCTWNRMANSVGGDFYAAQTVGDNKFVVCCFDVSGKNVSASLLTVTLASFFTMLRKYSKEEMSSLSLLSKLDEYLKEVMPVGNFITGVVCFVDRKANRIEMFNCGHTNVYVLLNGEEGKIKTASLKPTLPPFGMGAICENLKSQNGSGYRIPIQMGLQINIYSDGFTDMQNEEGIRYDDARALEFFKNFYNVDVYDYAKFVEKTVNDWIGRTMLPDDITIVNMRF